MLLNNTDSVYPVATRIPYPKTGSTNSAARVGVVAADGGDTKWMQTPGDPRDSYLARLEWQDDRSLAIQQLNRLQNQQDLLSADASSGQVSRVFRDRSESWVDVVDTVRWVDQGRKFLWLSERDGWRHIYLAAKDGTSTTLATKFDADVIQLLGTDTGDEWVYFIASPDDPTARYLYRTRTSGEGAPERVTPRRPAWLAQLSPGAGRPDGVPHLVAVRRAAGDRCRGAAEPPRAAHAHRHDGAAQDARAGAGHARSSSLPSRSATASRSTAGC